MWLNVRLPTRNGSLSPMTNDDQMPWWTPLRRWRLGFILWVDFLILGLLALEATALASIEAFGDIASSLIIGLCAGLGSLWSNDDSTISWRWAVALGLVAALLLGALVAFESNASFGAGAVASVAVALTLVGIVAATRPIFQRGVRASLARS